MSLRNPLELSDDNLMSAPEPSGARSAKGRKRSWTGCAGQVSYGPIAEVIASDGVAPLQCAAHKKERCDHGD